MDGFKNSTKTQYSQGGSCYAKGGAVKGAAKVAKVMNEFKSGSLHSGSKGGPKVTNPKQAIAISLSEGKKAGMATGGATKSYSAKNAAAGKDIGKPGKQFGKIAASASTEYGSKAAGERVAGAILNKMRNKAHGGVMKKAMGGPVDDGTVDESSEENVRGIPQRDTFRKRHGLEVSKTTVREVPAEPQTELSRRLSGPPERAAPRGKPAYRDIPLIGGALGEARDLAKKYLGLKKGGLAAMPGKKC